MIVPSHASRPQVWRYSSSRVASQAAPVVLGADTPAVGVVSVDPTAPPYGLLVIGLPSADCGVAGATASDAVIAEDLPVKVGDNPP